MNKNIVHENMQYGAFILAITILEDNKQLLTDLHKVYDMSISYYSDFKNSDYDNENRSEFDCLISYYNDVIAMDIES